MNDQSRMRWNLVSLIVGALILIVGGGIYLDRVHKQSPLYTTKLVDKDTGQILYSQPNQKPEGNATSYIFIFGSDVLLKNGATQAQFQLIQQALTSYSKTNLANKYQTLTIIPKTFVANGGTLSGQLRLGETSNIVNFAIKLSQLKYVEVSIQDMSNQNGGNYDSGQLSVTTTN